MLLILSLALTVQTTAIPPALPQDPGPERRTAAAALFDADPNASQNSWGLQIAASMIAGEILRERNVNSLDRDARLSRRFIDRVRASSEMVINQAIGCVSEPMAQTLTTADLTALRRFTETPEGRSFWRHFVQTQPWQACFDPPVRRQLEPYVEGDLAAVIAETPVR